MIKGVTTTGFHYKIPQERLNNYELLEALGDFEDNPLLLGTVVRLLLGDKQAKAFKEHHRDAQGMVPVDVMTTALTEIFQQQSVKK